MAVTDELNRVKYVAEDFATYRAEADGFFREHYPEDYNNLINTDLGNALMDQLAFAMQSLSFMMNRRASELFLDTARLTKSVTKIARMLGYPIAPASPATTTAFVGFLNAPYNRPISIPPGFQFQGPGDTVYEYADAAPAVLNPGQTSLSLKVREGRTRQVSFVSDGSAGQQFGIHGVPVGEYLYAKDMVVTVDGIEWERLPFLTYEERSAYEVTFTDSPPKLRFGDGIAGRIPPDGSSIVMRFRCGQGLRGGVGSNQLTGPVTPLVVGGSVIPLVVTNEVATVGSDPEDVGHVKAYASSFFRTQNAAVIKSDYDTIAQLREGVALADADIVRGVDSDLTIQQHLSGIADGQAGISAAMANPTLITLTGTSGLTVTGKDQLTVLGTGDLAVGGLDQLAVGNTNLLVVGGTEGLRVGTAPDGETPIVLGVEQLFVANIPRLVVNGQGSLVVKNVDKLRVGGADNLGIGGSSAIGVSTSALQAAVTTGIGKITDSAASLRTYLSRALSDTSKANQVQVVILGKDSNNRYIAPSPSVLTDVEETLQGLADAVVTVVAVDGSSNIVNADIRVEVGISQTAVQTEVQSQITQSLIRSVTPYGLLVQRRPGESLYLSEIQDAIRAATKPGDVVFMNIRIESPQGLLDEDGNLIINRQQVIQNNNVTVVVVGRFLGKNLISMI